MLVEYKEVYQPIGEPKRRWFSDYYFDLIVWYTDEDIISGFQLCYDKSRNQRAMTWKRPSSYSHMRIDDGENRPGQYKATPILVPDGIFDIHSIAERFKHVSNAMDPAIAILVYEKILEYQNQQERI